MSHEKLQQCDTRKYKATMEKIIENYRQRCTPCERPDLQVYLITGPSGTGKTYSVCCQLENRDDLYIKHCSSACQSNDFWDGYTGQAAVLFDNFDDRCYYIRTFLDYLGKYPINLQVRGGVEPAKYTRVYITTNKPLATWFPMLACASAYKKAMYTALCRRITHRVHLHVPMPHQYDVKAFDDIIRFQLQHEQQQVQLDRAVSNVDPMDELTIHLDELKL